MFPCSLCVWVCARTAYPVSKKEKKCLENLLFTYILSRFKKKMLWETPSALTAYPVSKKKYIYIYLDKILFTCILSRFKKTNILRHSKCTYSLSWKKTKKCLEKLLFTYILSRFKKKMPLETPSALTAYKCTYSLSWMEKNKKNVSWDTPSALTAYPICKKIKKRLEKLQCTDSLPRFKWPFRKPFPKLEVKSLCVSFHWIFLIHWGFYHGPITFKLRSNEPPTWRSLVTETWQKWPTSFVFELCLRSLERGFENVTSNGITVPSWMRDRLLLLNGIDYPIW